MTMGNSSAPEDPASHGASASLQGWPARCSLAELARILTMLHGHQAPSESSLKKWSAAGAFSGCVALPHQPPGRAPSSATRDVLIRHLRGGRPGLQLDTQGAIARVYAQWPHLADSGAPAALDLAAARAADHLEARLGTVLSAVALGATTAEVDSRAASEPCSTGVALQQVLEQMTAMRQEMARMRSELAQFSAMRNNLITKLDNAVSRAQGSNGAGAPAASMDPLIEARHNRDMGVLKSMLGEILAVVTKSD